MPNTVNPASVAARPFRQARFRLIVIAAVGLLVLLWCGLLARDILLLRADWQGLQSIRDGVSGSSVDLAQIQARVASAHANLEALRDHAGPVLAILPALGWLPGIGGDVQAAPAVLDLAVELVAGGDRALQALAPLWPPRSADGRSAVEQLAGGLEAARSDLIAVRDHVDRAGEIRQRIDPTRLSGSARSMLDKFDAIYPAARAGAGLLAVAPQLLGVDRPRTYLILVQNEDELRPTGGFLTAVGRVTLDAGRIVTLTVVDSYEIDDFTKPYGDPPAPLYDIMGLQLWVFRDSNWSPDFPTSARKAAELYAYTQGGMIDGVIGLDQRVVEALIAALGPIEVEPGTPPLTADTVRSYMQLAWAPPRTGDVNVWWGKRKRFVGQLAQAILDRVLNGTDRTDWLALGRSINDVLGSRDLLIYMRDDSAASPLAGAGWDGAVQPSKGDFLMAVDANMGFNKVNAVVSESLAYTATLSAQGPNVAELTLTYTNTAALDEGCVHAVPSYGPDQTYEDLVQQCYWNYRRVLVPVGAQLIGTTRIPIGAGQLITQRPNDGATAPSTEAGKTVFSTLILVGRGQRLDTHLRYSLPRDVLQSVADRRVYHLRIQKQPGAGRWPVSATVVWPSGYQLVDAAPLATSVSANAATFQAVLNADVDVTLVFKSAP